MTDHEKRIREALEDAEADDFPFADVRAVDLRALLADLDAVRGALDRLCGAPGDPNNGWRGTRGTDVFFACEYCGATHEDCTKIEHTDSCPIPAARAALKGATA